MSRGFSIVLTADRSQMSNFLGSPLVGFFSCVPCEYIPKVAYEHLLCPSVETDNHSGEVKVAPLSLRRVEAALLEAYPRQDVCIAHPMHLEKAVGENTKIVGLSEMDPRGIGPVTTSMGSNLTPFNRYWFADLAAKLRVLKRKYGFKVVLGGPASWQFAEKKHREVYGIDHVVDGEIDSAAVDVFQDILDGDADELIRVSTNSVGEVPLIRGPTVMGMIEAMRGCGRGCSFCSPNLRMKRQFPVERLRKEAQVNSLYGFTHIWLHAEDMLLYGCDKGDMIPNESAITELFKGIRSIRGVKRAAVTHWSLAGVVANPHVLSSLAEINKLGPREWTGVQVGLETSSRALVRRYLRCKTDPFSPEEYPWLIREGTEIMNRNYYYPSYTLVIGLPEETDDDVDETIEMVKRLERYRCILAPLLYVNYWKQEESMTFEGMTSKQWELFCICWYHNLRQVNESVLQATASYSPLIKATALVAAKWGTRRVLNYLRDVTRLRQKQAQVCGQRPLASAVCPSGTLSLRNV